MAAKYDYEDSKGKYRWKQNRKGEWVKEYKKDKIIKAACLIGGALLGIASGVGDEIKYNNPNDWHNWR